MYLNSPAISLQNRQRRIRLNLRWLRQAAAESMPWCLEVSDDGQFALREIEEISVAIVSDRAIAQIHVDFMGIEGATDVITFNHGDIVVSAETAAKYASQYHHSIEQELALYTIHGLLHLNGFDDLSPGPAARMRRAQDRIWRRVLGAVPLP